MWARPQVRSSPRTKPSPRSGFGVDMFNQDHEFNLLGARGEYET